MNVDLEKTSSDIIHDINKAMPLTPVNDAIFGKSYKSVHEQLAIADAKIDFERQQAKAKANKFKLWLLKNYMSVKGWLKSLKFKKDETYYGGRNNRLSIYMGNCTFFEQITCKVPGFCYYDNKPIKYKYWEIGFFSWKKSTAKIETNKNNVGNIF